MRPLFQSRILRQLQLIALIFAIATFAGSSFGAEKDEEKSYQLPPSTPTDVNAAFDGFLKNYQSLRPEVEKLVTVRLLAKPALLKEGEKVTISLRVHAKTVPNSTIEIYPRYLETGMKEKETLQLNWVKAKTAGTGDLAVYESTLQYLPKAKGNYVIHWKNDIGGDIPEFWRYFAVIDNSFAVLSLETTNNPPEHSPDPLLHELHLPFVYWEKAELFREGWSAEQWAAVTRKNRQFGDTPAFMVWCSDRQYVKPNPDLRDAKKIPMDYWWQVPFNRETPEVQRLVLERYKKDVWPILGFNEPIENLHTYGIGNTSVPMARELGYKTIGSLCASQNYKDGTFPINHFGMPDRPFFISKEDFRKTGDGGLKGIVGVQQCHRHMTLCSDVNCVYSLEPMAVFHGVLSGFSGKALGAGRQKLDEIAFSHILDFFEAMLQNRLSQNSPYFFNAGLEFGGEYPGAEEANNFFLRYAARKTAVLPLAFASGDAISDFYRRHYTKTPETTCYLPDVFCGYFIEPRWAKPPVYPDIMEIEGPQFKVLNREPAILPYKQYDYTTRWQYPDWQDNDLPRLKDNGNLVPDTDDRFKVEPKIIDTRTFKATRQDTEKNDSTEVVITVESKTAQKRLALSLWNIPCEWKAGADGYVASPGCRFVPVRAPFSGNLNGFLIADVKPGVNRFTLTVKTPPPHAGPNFALPQRRPDPGTGV